MEKTVEKQSNRSAFVRQPGKEKKIYIGELSLYLIFLWDTKLISHDTFVLIIFTYHRHVTNNN